ncbi:MAG: hypothetical protein ACNYNY_00090 [Candidatus Oxydemutatoraceae bacterium WSBS_2016_MAG_OTU14]
MLWKIDYWNEEGEACMHVFAQGRAQAVDASHVPASRIIAVRVDWWCFRKYFGQRATFTHHQQLLMLLNIQASCLTGHFNDAVKYLSQGKDNIPTSGQELIAQREDLNLSQRLAALKFDRCVCTVIASSETVGQLDRGISAAIQYLKQMIYIHQQTSQTMYISGVIFALVTTAFFVIPPLIYGSLQPFLNVEGINFSATFATSILLWLGGDSHVGLWFGGGFLLLACLTVRFYDKLHFYPLTLLHEIQKSRRSSQLLVVWALYRVSGIVLEHDTNALRQTLTPLIANQILERLRQGEALVQTITPQHFSQILVQAMPALNQFNDEHLTSVTSLLLENIKEDTLQKKRKLSVACYMIATGMALSLVVLLSYGLMFPLFSSLPGLDL